MSKTCYMCNRFATSNEHVPPKGIFPKRSDFPDKDYRKNLIKVPSCDLHNSEKSKDDEYFQVVVCTHIENNEAGVNQFTTKILRSMSRNPKLLRIMQDAKTMYYDGQPAVAFKVDPSRIYNVCEHAARGLYFYEFKKKWTHEIKLATSALVDGDPAQAQSVFDANRQLKALCDQFLNQHECDYKGDNPEIFKYRLSSDHKTNFVVQMVFYDGFIVNGFSNLAESRESE